MAATSLFRRKVALLPALFAITLLAGCGELGFNNWRWHQKLSVTVDVGGEIVSGSAVSSVLWWPNFFSGGWGGAAWLQEVQGEAVVVDLGERGVLFALLSRAGDSAYTAKLAGRMLTDTPANGRREAVFAAVLASAGRVLEVPPERYPLLVTFTDIADPTTVKRVDPDDLAATFGPGVALKRITLEITDEAVTEGEVEKKVLGWLETIGNTMLDGRSISTIKAKNRLANDLSAGSFATRR
ncbi:MAG: hypothetical protein RIB97_02055 [Nitratireductor sp.]